MVGLPPPQPSVVCMPATTLTLLPMPGTNFRGTTPASLARGRGSEHRAQGAPTPRRPAATGCSLFCTLPSSPPPGWSASKTVPRCRGPQSTRGRCAGRRSPEARPSRRVPVPEVQPPAIPDLAWPPCPKPTRGRCACGRPCARSVDSRPGVAPVPVPGLCPTAAVPAAARLGPAQAAAALCPILKARPCVAAMRCVGAAIHGRRIRLVGARTCLT